LVQSEVAEPSESSTQRPNAERVGSIEVAEARRSRHKAVVVLTRGVRPGLYLLWSKYSREQTEFMMDVPHARQQMGSAVGVRQPRVPILSGARRTIQGYEVVHMIRKGQVRSLPKGDVPGLIMFLNQILGLSAE
jgi:hypothetical protein